MYMLWGGEGEGSNVVSAPGGTCESARALPDLLAPRALLQVNYAGVSTNNYALTEVRLGLDGWWGVVGARRGWGNGECEWRLVTPSRCFPASLWRTHALGITALLCVQVEELK